MTEKRTINVTMDVEIDGNPEVALSLLMKDLSSGRKYIVSRGVSVQLGKVAMA